MMKAARSPAPPADLPGAWRDLAVALPAHGRVLVLGPSDAGKTTLVWWLAGELAARCGGPGAVAIVDADLGQSRVGPPGSVGWQKLDGAESGFYFVGATSPARRPSSALQASVQAAEAAGARGCAWTVIDSSGYVRDQAAIALNRAVISRLRPLHVVAIGDEPALGDTLSPWRDDPTVVSHRLCRAAAARDKSRPARSRWRDEGFGEWLMGSNLRFFSPQGRRFLHAPPAELYAGSPEGAAQLRGLLVGFSDEAGRGICVGLLWAIDWREGRILVLCPAEAEDARQINFGCVRLEADGTQIG